MYLIMTNNEFVIKNDSGNNIHLGNPIVAKIISHNLIYTTQNNNTINYGVLMKVFIEKQKAYVDFYVPWIVLIKNDIDMSFTIEKLREDDRVVGSYLRVEKL